MWYGFIAEWIDSSTSHLVQRGSWSKLFLLLYNKNMAVVPAINGQLSRFVSLVYCWLVFLCFLRQLAFFCPNTWLRTCCSFICIKWLIRLSGSSKNFADGLLGATWCRYWCSYVWLFGQFRWFSGYMLDIFYECKVLNSVKEDNPIVALPAIKAQPQWSSIKQDRVNTCKGHLFWGLKDYRNPTHMKAYK